MDGSKRANGPEPGFVTKDSGKRAEYASGMVRDTEEGKARFDLLFPLDVPFKEQMLTRFADLMARGAEKYDERNWEKARGPEEMARYRSSAMRHLVQWETGEEDEDHAAAVMFNLLAYETTKYRQRQFEQSFGDATYDPNASIAEAYGSGGDYEGREAETHCGCPDHMGDACPCNQHDHPEESSRYWGDPGPEMC